MIEGTRQARAASTDEFLRSAMSHCHEAGLSFALWKLPHSQSVQFAASQEAKGTHDINLEAPHSGFLFSPFDPGEKKIFLPADELIHCEAEQIVSISGSMANAIRANEKTAKHGNRYYTTPAVAKTISSESYMSLVAVCRDAVSASMFEKIVPSRCKEIQLQEDFDIAETFLALAKRYPTAMVSVFSSPLTGTWMGATPETLVRIDSNQHFHTAAIAGTQPFRDGMDIKTITWTQKEIEEQALVERYIISCFKKIRLREFEEHGPKTVIAGNVLHLKTDFEVDMVATHYPQLGSVMLQLMHPTSAVCGMPLESSLAFLKKHEGYNRQYYSGFLGPVHIQQESQLFVNLRCMQLLEGKALLYAGAGVLADSDPQSEWNETELKMNTLLEVIRQ
jgi:isochorismate synthase